MSGSWSWSLSALGTVAGSCTLQSDASATPTTARAVASCSRGLTVGVVVGETGTMPWFLEYEVPAGHYYTLATSGTGIGASPLVTEQVL